MNLLLPALACSLDRPSVSFVFAFSPVYCSAAFMTARRFSLRLSSLTDFKLNPVA